jgi:large subunit ribosomal protein L29
MKLGEIRAYRDKLRGLSAVERADEMVKLRKEQFALRMQRATGQSPKPDQFGSARRNIARLKTLQREVALKGAPAATGGKKS